MLQYREHSLIYKICLVQKDTYMRELYYATSNQGKFEEVRAFLEKHAPTITLKQYTHELVEIQTLDQKAIACDKARQAWNALQKPVIVDDAGIYFEKYNQFPGTLSRYVYEGIGFEGFFKLVEPGDNASFLLTLVYCAGLNEIHIFEAANYGRIVRPRGDGPKSLPFLMIFAPYDSEQSFAELRNTPQWPQYNCRLQAVQKFIDWATSHNQL